MADCEMLATCLFFHDKLRDMPLQAEFFKDLYCRGNSSICARYLVIKELGPQAVPADLFPNHEAKARQILADFGSRK
jgi:hypothetical protein